jgi:hypothetical protein
VQASVNIEPKKGATTFGKVSALLDFVRELARRMKHQKFQERCCCHMDWDVFNDASKEIAAPKLRLFQCTTLKGRSFRSSLKMKTTNSFEVLVAICQSTRHTLSEGKMFVNSIESIKRCERGIQMSYEF